MALSIGIVGFPNVGKSTLFRAITKKQVDCQNYPFCTIDPNVGVVAVPDERVDKLAEFSNSSKKIYATVEFVDIAGLVEGASKGEGLGNKFLANIRETNTIVYILRAFKNENIVNTQKDIDVIRDKEILDTEMALKDLTTVEKRIFGIEKEIRAGNKKAKEEKAVLEKANELLKEGRVLADFTWQKEEKEILKTYQLLTLKPRLYLINGKEGEICKDTLEIFKKNSWSYLIIDILSESDAIDLNFEERKEFGLPQKLHIDKLIESSYKLLNLITFLTTGKDETRAWVLKKGEKAPQAGGVIHSDFEKHFIKAEVISWKDLLDSGSIAKAREKGMIRTEGKDYIVKDGDVIEIKSNA